MLVLLLLMHVLYPHVMQIGNPCFPFQFFYNNWIIIWCFAICICVDVRPWDQFDSNSLEVFIQLYKPLLILLIATVLIVLNHGHITKKYKFITVIFPSLSVSSLHFSSTFSTLPSLLPHHEDKSQRTQNKNKEAKR